jgi:hypothetical protein
MSAPYERFKGIVNWTDDNKIGDLAIFGIKEWLKWSFLNIGAFQNIDISQSSGILGGHPSILRSVESPNYDNGQVWEGFRGDWVWETGIEYSTTPNVCSGVYVDNVFYETSSTSGEFAHYVNYLDGQIIFDSPIDTSSTVQTSFAPRLINVVDLDVEWFTELLYNSFNISRSDFLNGTGPYAQLAQSRRCMPLLGIGLQNFPVPHPWALGGGQIFAPNLLIYLLSEDKQILDNLISILICQNDKTIYLLDLDAIKQGNYPYDLDYRGMTVANPLTYPDLVDAYQWTKGKLINASARVIESNNDWLYKAVISFSCEMIITNV